MIGGIKMVLDKNELTTIAVMPSTKALLDKLKVHPNQSYDEIIREIVKKINV